MGGKKKSPKVNKCSGCKQEHSHPFGKRCIFLVSQVDDDARVRSSSQSEHEIWWSWGLRTCHCCMRTLNYMFKN